MAATSTESTLPAFSLPDGFLENLPTLVKQASTELSKELNLPQDQIVPIPAADRSQRSHTTSIYIRKKPTVQVLEASVTFWSTVVEGINTQTPEALTSLISRFLKLRALLKPWIHPSFFKYENSVMEPIYSRLPKLAPNLSNNRYASAATAEFTKNFPLLVSYSEEAASIFIKGVSLLSTGSSLTDFDVSDLIKDSYTLRIFVHAQLASLFSKDTLSIVKKGFPLFHSLNDVGEYLTIAAEAEDSELFIFFVNSTKENNPFNSFSLHLWAQIFSRLLANDDKEKIKKMLAAIFLENSNRIFPGNILIKILSYLSKPHRQPLINCFFDLNPTLLPKHPALLSFLTEEQRQQWLNLFSAEDVCTFFSNYKSSSSFTSEENFNLLVYDASTYCLDKFSEMLESLTKNHSQRARAVFHVVSIFYSTRPTALNLPKPNLARFEIALTRFTPTELNSLFTWEKTRKNYLHRYIKPLLHGATNSHLKMRLALALLTCDIPHPAINETENNGIQYVIKRELTEQQYQVYQLAHSQSRFRHFESLNHSLGSDLFRDASWICSHRTLIDEETPTCFSRASSTPISTALMYDFPQHVATWLNYFERNSLILTLPGTLLASYRDFCIVATGTEWAKHRVEFIDLYARFSQEGLASWQRALATDDKASTASIAIKVCREYLETPFSFFFHSTASTLLIREVSQYLQQNQTSPASQLLTGILTLMREPDNFATASEMDYYPGSWKAIDNGKAAGILRTIIGKLVIAARLEPEPSIAPVSQVGTPHTPSPSSSNFS